jgi:hypothetical protein
MGGGTPGSVASLIDYTGIAAFGDGAPSRVAYAALKVAAILPMAASPMHVIVVPVMMMVIVMIMVIEVGVDAGTL